LKHSNQNTFLQGLLPTLVLILKDESGNTISEEGAKPFFLSLKTYQLRGAFALQIGLPLALKMLHMRR
jgi:hypothetical protein